MFYVLVCTGVCKYIAWYMYMYMWFIQKLKMVTGLNPSLVPFRMCICTCIYMYVVSDYVYASLRNFLNNYIVHVHVVHVC